jgi:hypothetical protein
MDNWFWKAVIDLGKVENTFCDRRKKASKNVLKVIKDDLNLRLSLFPIRKSLGWNISLNFEKFK